MVQMDDSDGRTPFAGRLIEAMRDAGYPERGGAARLAREMRPVVSERAVGKWMSGDSIPDTKRIEHLSKLLRTSGEWLLTGRGRKSLEESEVVDVSSVYRAAHSTLPIISSVQAGEWGSAADPFEPGEADEWRDVYTKVGPSAFILRVKGDSMTNPNGLPSAPEGSLIVVDPDVVAEHRRLVVAKLDTDQEATFKMLVVDGGQRYLKPLNPDYRPIAVNGSCRIVGVVVQILQDV